MATPDARSPLNERDQLKVDFIVDLDALFAKHAEFLKTISESQMDGVIRHSLEYWVANAAD